MSDASTAGDGPVSLTGRVERQLLHAGTKSEHRGLVLVTDDGRRLRLRRRGGNPFQDEVLARLEGQAVTLTGQLQDDVLWLSL